MNTDVITLYWRGEAIGVLLNFQMDMWYYNGQFSPVKSVVATQFVELVSPLNPKDWFYNSPPLEQWIWIGWGENKPTHIVLSLKDNHLFLRLVTSVEGSW